MKPLLAFVRVAAAAVVFGLAVLALAGEAPAPAEGTESRDPRGWTVGDGVVKAAGLAEALSGGGPYPSPKLTAALLSLDAKAVDLDEIIDRQTLLFYFSATCHHCQAVAPELARLHARLGAEMDFIAIASAGNSTQEIKAFAEGYGLEFPFYKDFARQFSGGIKASSTPTVLVVQPAAGGGFESLSEFRPFGAGDGLLLEMQVRVQSKENPWSAIEPGRYYGAKACGACHEQEMASWLLTHHSVAYWTLLERKRAEDTACVGCHVTGLGLPTGFVLGDHESALTDVTCESCHGPGGAHGAERRSPEQLRAVCVGCHDSEHSVRFDVERAIPHIDHYQAVRKDPEAFRLARETLLAGRAPRPLLAFPDGANQGSAVCASCHKAAHRSWKKSRHGRAGKTLQAKGSGSDPECLGCHALPKTDQPSTAKDFHAEGVGCESCHGPGEEHVAAGGGRENIVGLGATCPECVIEAICTRCHTPEQDPDWELSSRLGALKH